MPSRRALQRMGPHEQGTVEKTRCIRGTRSWCPLSMAPRILDGDPIRLLGPLGKLS